METFVVRVYIPQDPLVGGIERRLCGVVQHVRSGRSRTFRDAEELQRIIAEEAATRMAAPIPAEVEA